MQPLGTRLRAVGIALALVVVLVPAVAAQAQTFNVLYNFTGSSDGGYPYANVIADAKGNLYGTTDYAGASDYGVVFEVVPKTKTETVLYSFTGGSDGGYPYAGLVLDKKGNLYGTATYFGSSDRGTVFEVMPKTKTETVLYSFTGSSDGGYPYAGLIMDTKGNLYGTTYEGGASGNGVVYEVAPKTKSETVLYTFTGTTGQYPFQGLLAGRGFTDLYGSTEEGGTYGYGTVYKLVVKTGTETVLHSFDDNGTDGAYPQYGYLVQDTKGNLYGTTYRGGSSGYGTVFEVNEKTGKETILYNFTGGSDGGSPVGGLAIDSKDNLYGTTESGGANSVGTIFKVVPKTKTETVLHSFDYSPDGGYPIAAPLLYKGNLYGTAEEGGSSSYGTVWELIP
jgi:uncharacterized repeat protein (TIGR03803 family)